MFRKLAAILAVTLACATGAAVLSDAWAQDQAPPGAPTVHPGTKLNFMPSLGGFQLYASTIQGSPANRAELSYDYRYLTPQKLQIDVTVYDAGRRVPNGSDNPTVLQRFGFEIDSVEQQVRAAGYTNFERQAVASNCSYGVVTFRCASLSARTPVGRVHAKLLLTGYRDNFLKIRIDWSQAANQTAADADRALEAFITALIH